MNNKIIAVDFDGCLVTNEFPQIGEPIQETLSALLNEQRHGAKIILWTCRMGDKMESAAKWCAEHGIKLAAVNDNIPEVIEFFGENPRKIFANEYWDDRAIRYPAKPINVGGENGVE